MITKEKPVKAETLSIDWKKFNKWQSETIVNAMRKMIFSLARNQ